MASFIRSLSKRFTTRSKRTTDLNERRIRPTESVISAGGVDSGKAVHCKVLLLDGTDLTIAIRVCWGLFVGGLFFLLD